MDSENKFDCQKSSYSKLILDISFPLRKVLFEMEEDRISKNLDEEKYLNQKLDISGYTNISIKSKTTTNDDGVDLLIKHENFYILGQLKWWKDSCVSFTKTKEIFGSLMFSDVSAKYENNECIFFLLAPFVSLKAKKKARFFINHKCHIVSGNDFVCFMIDSRKYIAKILKEYYENNL